jgi:FkbM family methyltransferase
VYGIYGFMFTVPSGNISFQDKAMSYLSLLKFRVTIISICKSLFSNYFGVIYRLWKNKYPIKALSRNGNTIEFKTFAEVYNYLILYNHSKFEYDIDKDTVIISGINATYTKVILYGSISGGGDIISIFLHNEYASLPVKDKTVIDIGANIADSSIYFALHGASKVIALEPYPRNYELAKKNISANNFSNNVIALLAACGASNGYIIVDPNKSDSSILHKSTTGINVPVLTLKNILNEYNIDSRAVLKMDCEGCEYDSIISSDQYTLQKFDHIQIEYHHGYRNLKEKLERSGFKVSITRPRFTKYNMYVGWVYAQNHNNA